MQTTTDTLRFAGQTELALPIVAARIALSLGAEPLIPPSSRFVEIFDRARELGTFAPKTRDELIGLLRSVRETASLVDGFGLSSIRVDRIIETLVDSAILSRDEHDYVYGEIHFGRLLEYRYVEAQAATR